MKPVIGVDCDGVLVNTLDGWYEDLKKKYQFREGSEELVIDGKLPYNLTSMFNIPCDEDGMSYWKSSTLYSGLKPIENSVSVLNELSKDFDLVVISRVTGDHASNKCRWIKKHFPFIDGIILTGNNHREKTFVNCDYIIEDSLGQLSFFQKEVKKIHYVTKYYQEQKSNFEYSIVTNWREVEGLFNGKKK